MDFDSDSDFDSNFDYDMVMQTMILRHSPHRGSVDAGAGSQSLTMKCNERRRRGRETNREVDGWMDRWMDRWIDR